MSDRKPIIYETTVPVRFGDLDPYGHVGAHEYLGFVVGSRWQYAQDVLKIAPSEFIEKGVAFYMNRAETDFVRPIVGTPIVVVKSHVAEATGSKLAVPFQVESTADKGSKVFCKGLLSFVVMDLKTMRPQDLPAWVEPYFFQ